MASIELNGTLDRDQISALSDVYLVFLTPSVIGSFSVLVVSIVKWRHLQQQVHLLVQLALADLLAALILMFTSVMNKTGTSSVICLYCLPLSLTFYFVSFLLVVVYAWKSKNAIRGWRSGDEGGQRQCRWQTVAIPVYAMAWLIPIAMYLTYILTFIIKPTLVIPNSDRSANGIIQNDSMYCTSCILFLHVWRDSCSDYEKIHDTFIKIFLILIVVPVMLSCSVIYHNVRKWYERHQDPNLFPVEGDGRSRRKFKRMISTARNMVMVILFCWTPALMLILMSTLMTLTDIEQKSLFGLYMIQAASVSLQGFLNSMVYAWRRPNFTEAVLGENTPLVAQYQLPFFDESLRS